MQMRQQSHKIPVRGSTLQSLHPLSGRDVFVRRQKTKIHVLDNLKSDCPHSIVIVPSSIVPHSAITFPRDSG